MSFLHDCLRQWHRRRITRNIETARRSGLGVYLHEWRVSLSDATHEGIQSLEDGIVEWCRHTAAHCRRPWGIDHFDLALAYVVGDQGPVQTARFRSLRPDAFYDFEGFIDQLGAFLRSSEMQALPPDAIHVAAALYSWGDLAHAALPPMES